MKRLFIMSSERSGSNLLRSMLDAHPLLIAPSAAHFTTFLAKYAGCYGDLSKDGPMRSLVRDFGVLAEAHMEPWPWRLDVDAIARSVERPDFWGAFVGVYDHIAGLEGRSGWVCKDNRVFEFAGELVATTDAKLVYLVRDGRDFALSFFDSPFGPRTLTGAATLWMREQLSCMRVAATFPDRVLTVRYEDLVDEPERELKRICAHAGIEYDPAMLSFHESERARSMAAASGFWKNLSRPVIKGNHSKWRTRMRPGAVLYFQHIAGLALAGHGYEIRPGNPGPLRARFRPLADNAREALGKLLDRLRPPEGARRRPKQAAQERIARRLAGGDPDQTGVVAR